MGPSTTIPDSAKAISMLADSGSVLEVAAVFYHDKFYIQCLNKLKNQPDLSSVPTNLSQTETHPSRSNDLPTFPSSNRSKPTETSFPKRSGPNGPEPEAFRERLEGYGSPDWLWEVQLHGRFLKEPAGNMWLRRGCVLVDCGGWFNRRRFLRFLQLKKTRPAMAKWKRRFF